VWQVRVSLGRSPATGHYSYASTTVRGGRRDAQRAAAKLVNQGNDGLVATNAGTLDELLSRWLTHLEGLGRAPKTLVEHRRMAAEVSARLGRNKALQRYGTPMVKDAASRRDCRSDMGVWRQKPP